MLRRRDQRGSAVVDFVLLAVILMPIVLGILHLALVLHVRNTLVSAASEGARYAATLDRGPADGRTRAGQEITGALSGRFARNIDVRRTSIGGAQGVVVTIRATVPPLGLWGPSTQLTATGHAIDEAGQ